MQATKNAVTVFFIDYVFSQMGVFIISIFFQEEDKFWSLLMALLLQLCEELE